MVTKNYLLVGFGIIVMLFALGQSGVASSVALFVIVGEVPGTPYVLSPGLMSLIIASALVLISFAFASRITRFVRVRRRALRQATRTKTLPKRRYNRPAAS